MCDTPNTNTSNTDLTKLQEIVNAEIRPALQAHGGDMEIVSYKNNVLAIKYQGACGGCPGAAMSTLPMIQEMLREKFNPEIIVKIA